MQVESYNKYHKDNIKIKKLDNLEDCPAELREDVINIIRSEGFIKCDVLINKLPVDGGNYTADLYEIDIVGITSKGNKAINIFSKQGRLIEGIIAVLYDVEGLYKNEIFFYKEVRQVFFEMQEEAKVPIEEQYKVVKYYDGHPVGIIMDNLSKQGYKKNVRADVVSIEYAEFAIKNLAKFHALSFAIEKNKPDFYESRIKTVQNPINYYEEWNIFQKSVLLIAMRNLDHDLKNRIEKTILGKLCKYRQYFENSQVSCLCHGDYRVMNLMTRQTGEKITDMIALDYQILHYGNPIMDFIYFVFTATDKKFRTSYLNYLKETYYKTLQDFLKYFNVDIEKMLSRPTFERIYEDTLDYGLIVVLTIGPIMFADETDAMDVRNSSVSNLNFKVYDLYNDLLKGIIEEFVEWGLL